MLFEKLIINNFGIYKGRHEVDLKPKNKNKPIILFGALNGAGKTTFLDSILLVLYGKFAKCSNRGSQSYQEYLNQSIQKDANPKKGASIELQFNHDKEGVQDNIRIIRSWFSTGKNIKENIEVYRNDTFDTFITDRWYDYVEEFIPSQISNLFFFDGERIEGLASSDKSQELIRTGVYALLGLDIIERASQDLIQIERQRKIEKKSNIDKSYIENIGESIESAKKERFDLYQKIAGLNNNIQQIESTIEELKKEYEKQGGDLFTQHNNLVIEQKTIKNQLDAITNNLRELAAGNAPLIIVQDLMERAYKQSLKEQEIKNRSILIDELIKRDKAVVQFLKDNNSDSQTISSLGDFLRADRKERNPKDIDCYIEIEPKFFSKAPLKSQTELRKKIQIAIAQSEEIKEKLNANSSKISAIPTKDSLSKLDKKIEHENDKKSKKLGQLSFLEKEHEKANKKILSKEENYLKLLEEKSDNEFSQISHQRVLRHSEKLRNTFSIFQKTMVSSQIKKLETLILKSYTSIIKKDNLINTVHIEPNSFKLSLIDNNGKELSSERLSAGERQLLVVSILWSLSKASGNMLPCVIDTPLGRLDGKHRKLLVENYFPNASQQVILLSTDEEVDSDFYEKLKPYISQDYLIKYDKNTSSSSITKGYFQ